MMSPLLAPFVAATPSSGFTAVWDFLHRGGIFMIPLIVTSVLGLMAILYKFLSLREDRVIPADLASEIEALPPTGGEPGAGIVSKCAGGESALARLGAVALRNREKNQAELVQAVESAARTETVHLFGGIGVLDVVITVAPLLGLLGTASGLVVIFQGLGETTDHVRIASGIAEALNTTIFGLAIAVPCIVAHGYFTRRIETLTARLESLLMNLVSALRGDAPHP